MLWKKFGITLVEYNKKKGFVFSFLFFFYLMKATRHILYDFILCCSSSRSVPPYSFHELLNLHSKYTREVISSLFPAWFHRHHQFVEINSRPFKLLFLLVYIGRFNTSSSSYSFTITTTLLFVRDGDRKRLIFLKSTL